MKKQSGFTLIELVVVIVILGVLAVTAVPRFVNLQSDARASSLQGLKGAMAGAASIVYSKAAIAGIETKDSGVIPDGNKAISVVHGYPEASKDGIGSAVEGLFPGGDWQVIPSSSGTSRTSGSPWSISYTFADSNDISATAKCIVTYTEATSSAAPTIVVADAADC
ncbi:MSHA biogenesis protein MshA [Vibrio sp. UCD-FRSSP16_10]|uniref:prepilin-type N-terminal cleavage/methylation domain-containing protein n=1 Tax=unclassified Vibrio TaxID=2614977 RepID=UPI0007FF72B1|nr:MULTISPECIES: prepilin-type N-terminal cleavage/methylation domain-containing protein [unclassified Vibrio]OBT08011.1 MSHA biogenesis protein MshA [Vibrio sp. UCD-FRSSP16_30]OBT17186.1 MSHA biogenesis protein MshA [Vibrio sp. UCD-FRSSP16_10]